MLLIGIAWALFVAAMMTQGVLSAPLSERILHGGAVGYGWLNAGWAIGAFISVFYAAISFAVMERIVSHVTMAIIAASFSCCRSHGGWRWLLSFISSWAPAGAPAVLRSPAR